MKSTVETKIIELVKLGHERAADLKASCGAVDVRSVAQLISDLASQLEVQFARSNALAAENVGLNKFIAESCYVQAGEDSSWHQAIDHAPETPATDAFLAEVRAQESAPLVRALTVIANSEQHDGETVVCDFDTLISVAAGSLSDHYADQLRKGLQS